MPPTPQTPEGVRSRPLSSPEPCSRRRPVFYGLSETMGVKISATDAALLGLLTRGELSGYDLQRAAETTGGFFWAPAKSRIYAVLRNSSSAATRRAGRSCRPAARTSSSTG